MMWMVIQAMTERLWNVTSEGWAEIYLCTNDCYQTKCQPMYYRIRSFNVNVAPLDTP